MFKERGDPFRRHESSLFKHKSDPSKSVVETGRINIHRQFSIRVSSFYYDISYPVLTYPNAPSMNYRRDNEEFNLIVRKNQIFFSRYKADSILGRGVFGIVYKCVDMETDEFVAVKIINSRPEYSEQSKIEAKILHQLRKSHYVVRVVDTFTEFNHHFIVFELLPYSIFRLLSFSKFRGFGIYLLARLAKHILKGIKDIHRNTIIHTDIKPENVMLTFESIKKFDKKKFLRIIDFSNAIYVADLKSLGDSEIQSRFYRSPEVFLGCCDEISKKVDLWSYGVMIYELYKGRPLFSGSNDFQIVEKMIRTLGRPPMWMIQKGRRSHRFFRPNGELKTEEEFVKDESANGTKVVCDVPPPKCQIEEVRPDLPSSPLRNDFSLQRRIMEHKVRYKRSSPTDDEEDETNLESKKTEFVEFIEMFIQWEPNDRKGAKGGLTHEFLKIGSKEENESKKRTKEEELKEEEEQQRNKEVDDVASKNDENSTTPQKLSIGIPKRRKVGQITFSVKDVSGDIAPRKRRSSFESFLNSPEGNDRLVRQIEKEKRQEERREKMRKRRMKRKKRSQSVSEEEEEEDESSLSEEEEEEGEFSELSDEEEGESDDDEEEEGDNDILSGENGVVSTSQLSTSSSSYTSVGSSTSSTTSSITRGLENFMEGDFSPSTSLGPPSPSSPFDYSLYHHQNTNFHENETNFQQQNGNSGYHPYPNYQQQQQQPQNQKNYSFYSHQNQKMGQQPQYYNQHQQRRPHQKYYHNPNQSNRQYSPQGQGVPIPTTMGKFEGGQGRTRRRSGGVGDFYRSSNQRQRNSRFGRSISQDRISDPKGPSRTGMMRTYSSPTSLPIQGQASNRSFPSHYHHNMTPTVGTGGNRHNHRSGHKGSSRVAHPNKREGGQAFQNNKHEGNGSQQVNYNRTNRNTSHHHNNNRRRNRGRNNNHGRGRHNINHKNHNNNNQRRRGRGGRNNNNNRRRTRGGRNQRRRHSDNNHLYNDYPNINNNQKRRNRRRNDQRNHHPKNKNHDDFHPHFSRIPRRSQSNNEIRNRPRSLDSLNISSNHSSSSSNNQRQQQNQNTSRNQNHEETNQNQNQNGNGNLNTNNNQTDENVWNGVGVWGHVRGVMKSWFRKADE